MESPATSHQVVFRYSRVKARLWLAFIAVMASVSLPTGLVMAAVIGPLAWLMTAVGAGLYGAMAHYFWRQLRDRSPVLVMNAEGIVDHRIGPTTIRWRSLKRIDHTTLRSSQVMALTFVSRTAAEEVFGLSSILSEISMKLDGLLIGLRPHAALELSSLEGSPRRAVKIAQALHARATRRAPGRA